MKDEELLEWYKNNGTKPADMSQQDYELNVNKALKLKQDQALEQNLASQQAAIKQAQTNAQQSASISNEKLMKYLGQAQLSSGIAKGQTSSDFINANNSYMNSRATIANNAAKQQTELLDSYASQKLANETQSYNNEMAILDKYRQREIEDKQLANAEETHQLEIEKGRVEIEAYRKEIQNTLEDRETSKEEKIKAEQQYEDTEWMELANEKINKMYAELMDNEGKLSNEDKILIERELAKYKNKMHYDLSYEKLYDIYKTLIYDGN